jgi:hypothetical protein
MQLGFVCSVKTVTGDATAHHKAFPRAMRKTLRLSSVKAKPATHQGVDTYMQTELRADAYHNQNLEFLDRPFDFDEFGDIDNEFDGLTIVEPLNETDLWHFCTGYDVL